MSFMEDQLDRRNSTYALSSRGGSEFGSQYMMESGFYITSFAATVFIASAITLVVLFMTLLITLTVMLQSCQSQSGGVVEQQKPITDTYAYCRLFREHAELNGLGPIEFPKSCHPYATQYITEGQYLGDLKLTILMAKRYLSSLALKDNFDIVLIDLDDILQSNNPRNTSQLQFRFDMNDVIGPKRIEELNYSVKAILLEFYSELRDSGWAVIYITRNPEKQRNVTEENLLSAGYGGWTSLIMRTDEEMKMETWEYLARRRKELNNQGFRIRSVISSKMEALAGPCLGTRNFKIVDPIYGLRVPRMSLEFGT
ncbi:uncharacterized protein At2g39920-like [Papaver somniferum]|uniref:uncharacterized protein At2g39920-like n=1 Tax=Papaver somniferum TaxID=3469 RepID=UPI000E704C39|nr:uncharacterized protein At2g39920-like [Papaver somniferum]XP_026426282.1 uncharacterized protein At2g39920-like [Papaver somniferum]XP_026426283.1 uncharacterized protein At2g39920-like [Papaver somniferum]